MYQIKESLLNASQPAYFDQKSRILQTIPLAGWRDRARLPARRSYKPLGEERRLSSFSEAWQYHAIALATAGCYTQSSDTYNPQEAL